MPKHLEIPVKIFQQQIIQNISPHSAEHQLHSKPLRFHPPKKLGGKKCGADNQGELHLLLKTFWELCACINLFLVSTYDIHINTIYDIEMHDL